MTRWLEDGLQEAAKWRRLGSCIRACGEPTHLTLKRFDSRLRRVKSGLVWRVASTLANGIRVARVQSSAMLSNTCCTTLLMQGAPAPAVTASPP